MSRLFIIYDERAMLEGPMTRRSRPLEDQGDGSGEALMTKKEKRRADHGAIDGAIDNMVRQGLVEVQIVDGQRQYRMTAKGLVEAQRLIATRRDLAELYARLEAERRGGTAVPEPEKPQ